MRYSTALKSRFLGLLAAALCLCGSAHGADFDPQSDGWNGLSYLLKTAAEARVDIEVVDTLDFDKLSPQTILFLVAPVVGPGDHLPSLRRYLDAGGRMVVADDFRAGYRWLTPFGIDLRNRPGPAEDHLADMRHLPRFSLQDLGPYLDFYDRRGGLEPTLVLNHPASLTVRDSLPRGVRGAIRGWYSDRARGWLAELDGKVRVLALADSSALINTMLRAFYGNKQLAANLMRYFCYVGEPCKVTVISGLKTVQGNFDAARWGDVSGRPTARDLRGRFRHMATQLADMLRKDELSILWWAIILLGLALPIVVGARTGSPVLPPRTANDRPQTRLQETVAAWLSVQDADYRQPARLLAGHLAGLVHRATDTRRKRSVVPTLSELPRAVEGLVAGGRLSAQAAQRIGDVVVELREVADASRSQVDRSRFTALAAEVEWAETVLSHTAEGLPVSDTSSTMPAKGAI